jgi:hypothetical protein
VIAPQLEQMPGFDWAPLYQTILLGLHTQQQAQQADERALYLHAQAQRMARDEDDVLILLMAA